MNAHTFLDDGGRRAVLEAIARAEKKSAAELSCVVATESGRYDRAESVVGIILGLVGLVAADALWAAAHPSGAWHAGAPLWALALGVAVGFLAGTALASALHPLRRAFVSRAEMDAEVARGAAAAFTRLRVGDTKGHTGLLVYVSLFERQVTVLLDQAVRAAAAEGFAAELCRKATDGLARGRRGDVLVTLVDAAADALAARLPPTPDDTNELVDRVVVLHPR